MPLVLVVMLHTAALPAGALGVCTKGLRRKDGMDTFAAVILPAAPALSRFAVAPGQHVALRRRETELLLTVLR